MGKRKKKKEKIVISWQDIPLPRDPHLIWYLRQRKQGAIPPKKGRGARYRRAREKEEFRRRLREEEH